MPTEHTKTETSGLKAQQFDRSVADAESLKRKYEIDVREVAPEAERPTQAEAAAKPPAVGDVFQGADGAPVSVVHVNRFGAVVTAGADGTKQSWSAKTFAKKFTPAAVDATQQQTQQAAPASAPQAATPAAPAQAATPTVPPSAPMQPTAAPAATAPLPAQAIPDVPKTEQGPGNIQRAERSRLDHVKPPLPQTDPLPTNTCWYHQEPCFYCGKPAGQQALQEFATYVLVCAACQRANRLRFEFACWLEAVPVWIPVIGGLFLGWTEFRSGFDAAGRDISGRINSGEITWMQFVAFMMFMSPSLVGPLQAKWVKGKIQRQLLRKRFNLISRFDAFRGVQHPFYIGKTHLEEPVIGLLEYSPPVCPYFDGQGWAEPKDLMVRPRSYQHTAYWSAYDLIAVITGPNLQGGAFTVETFEPDMAELGFGRGRAAGSGIANVTLKEALQWAQLRMYVHDHVEMKRDLVREVWDQWPVPQRWVTAVPPQQPPIPKTEPQSDLENDEGGPPLSLEAKRSLGTMRPELASLLVQFKIIQAIEEDEEIGLAPSPRMAKAWQVRKTDAGGWEAVVPVPALPTTGQMLQQVESFLMRDGEGVLSWLGEISPAWLANELLCVNPEMSLSDLEKLDPFEVLTAVMRVDWQEAFRLGSRTNLWAAPMPTMPWGRVRVPYQHRAR